MKKEKKQVSKSKKGLEKFQKDRNWAKKESLKFNSINSMCLKLEKKQQNQKNTLIWALLKRRQELMICRKVLSISCLADQINYFKIKLREIRSIKWKHKVKILQFSIKKKKFNYRRDLPIPKKKILKSS